MAEPTVEIEERTWNLVSAISKLWVEHEGDLLAIDNADLLAVNDRMLRVSFDSDGWYLLELTNEPAPPHVEYPERVPPDRKGSQ